LELLYRLGAAQNGARRRSDLSTAPYRRRGKQGLTAPADPFIAGYVSTLLEHEFELSSTIRVANGAVRVYAVPATRTYPQKILAALAKISGIFNMKSGSISIHRSLPCGFLSA
jgi:hypothetical protein